MAIVKTGIERLGRPAFNIDFVNSQQFPGWHNPLVRSTTATYLNSAGIIVTAQANEPRFSHHPETLLPRGLLLEQESTNHFTDYRFGVSGSANPSFNSGNGEGVTMTYGSGGALSPAGDFSATYVNAGSGGTTHRIVSQSNPLNGSPQTFSCFVKPDTTNRVSIDCDNIGINIGYYLNGDGSIHGTPLDSSNKLTDYFIEKWPGGWYRIGASITDAASGSTNDWRVYLANATHSTSFSATGESIYIWGAQLEGTRYATSIIKSVGGATTRAADFLGNQGTGNSTLNYIYAYDDYPTTSQPSQQGVMFYLHGEIDWIWDSGTNYYYFQYDSTGGNEYWGFRIGGSSGVMTLQVYNNTVYNSFTLGSSPVQRKYHSYGGSVLLPANTTGHHVKREFVIAGSLHPDTGMRGKGRYINPTDNHYYEDASQLAILSGATNPNLPGLQGYGQIDLFALSSAQPLRNGHIKCFKQWNYPAGASTSDVDAILTQLVEE